MKQRRSGRLARLRKFLTTLGLVLVGVFLLGCIRGCASPVVKEEAIDQEVVEELLRDGRLAADPVSEEHEVVQPVRWMGFRPGDELVFCSLRGEDGSTRFALVVECEPEEDRIVVQPLKEEETPLDVLDDPDRRAELVAVRAGESVPDDLLDLSLSELIEQRRFGPPLPPPRRVLAVAANFPSHLLHDLDVPPEVITKLQATPARVFQKHPPLHAPGHDPRPDSPFRGMIGPYDPIVFPDVVSLPDDEQGVTHVVPTFLDYEVELGFVLGRTLTWDDVNELGDDRLWEAVAGYVLVSDIKARNPQVFGRILSRDEVPTEEEQRYLTGDPAVDTIIGAWDESICAWWGYAASQGNYAALGPFFVASGGEERVPERAILAARSYAPEEDRGVELPEDRRPGPLYLRQCTRVSGSPDARDQLLWDPPAVIRAVLSPRGALDLGPEPRLERGDVIALGTPGGVALTVNRSDWYRVLDVLLFWWTSLDWHDAFFGRDKEKYLHQGDEVFLWGEGLGFQRLVVNRLELPELPERVETGDALEAEAQAEEEAEEMDLEGEVEEAQDPEVGKPDEGKLEDESGTGKEGGNADRAQGGEEEGGEGPDAVPPCRNVRSSNRRAVAGTLRRVARELSGAADVSHLVTVHSFRGGTGKSNLCANLAWLAAREGARVAVVDTDLQSPGVHIVFGTDESRIFNTLSEFVQGRCQLEDVAIDLTNDLDAGEEGGRLYLLPSSMKLEAITKILSDGYPVETLNQDLVALAEEMDLDYVLLDTHPGLNRETMLSAAVCDTLLLLVRPDHQDFEGTAVVVEVARRIDVPTVRFIANKVLDDVDPSSIKAKIEEAFGYEVAGVLPLDRDVARAGSRGVFAAENPDHPFTERLKEIQATILPVRDRLSETES